MKTKILFSLILVISACGSIAAQEPATQERPRRALPTETGPPDADAPLKEVTLYWYHKSDRLPFPPQPDDSRSSVNFETGERGPARGGGAFDLRYGGMVIGAPGNRGPFLADWIGGLDCRSMLIDLGAKTWQDFKTTPPLPSPQFLTESQALAPCTVVIDASAGSREISPYHQAVVAKPGHVYFMRLVNGSKVSYLMFRVESLNSKESCVISWKPVTPPNVDKTK
jgi:hypothetical protein